MAQLTASLIRSAVDDVNAGRTPNLTPWEFYQLLNLAMGRVGTPQEITEFPEFTADKVKRVFTPSDSFTPPPVKESYRLALVMSGGGPNGASTETRMEIAEVTAEQLRTLRMTQIGSGGCGSGGTIPPDPSGVGFAIGKVAPGGNGSSYDQQQTVIATSGGGGIASDGAAMTSGSSGEVKAGAFFVKDEYRAINTEKGIPVPFKEDK